MMLTNNLQVAGKSKFEIGTLIRRGECTINLLAEEIRNESNRMLGTQNNGFVEAINSPKCDWRLQSTIICIEKREDGISIVCNNIVDKHENFRIQLDFATTYDGEIIPITGVVFSHFATENDLLEMYFNTIVHTLTEFWTEKFDE